MGNEESVMVADGKSCCRDVVECGEEERVRGRREAANSIALSLSHVLHPFCSSRFASPHFSFGLARHLSL
jgi:hypothetical protein